MFLLLKKYSLLVRRHVWVRIGKDAYVLHLPEPSLLRAYSRDNPLWKL